MWHTHLQRAIAILSVSGLLGGAAGAAVAAPARLAGAAAAPTGAAPADPVAPADAREAPAAPPVTVVGLGGAGGAAPALTVTPSPLDFGEIRFDQQATRTLCILNDESTALDILAGLPIAPAPGTDPGTFTTTGSILKRVGCADPTGAPISLPEPLAPGEALIVSVQVGPASRTGALAAQLTVTSNRPTNPTRVVSLRAQSITGALTYDPAGAVNFGPRDVLAPPATSTVTLRNPGAAPIDVSGFARTGSANFSAQLPAGTRAIPPGGALPIPIEYRPSSATADAGQIQFTVAGVLGTTSGAIALQGRGIDRDLAVDEAPVFPPTLRSPGALAPARAAVIRNRGEAPLLIMAAVITSADPEAGEVWQLEAPPLPAAVAPGETLALTVRFSPTAEGAAPAAALVITSDDRSPPMTAIPLAGTGIRRRVEVAGPELQVGITRVGEPLELPDALLVTSTDPSATYRIREILVDDGPFAVLGDPAGAALPPGGEQRLGVRFTPDTVGDFTATAWLFLDDDPLPQASVTLRGTAVFVEAAGGGGCAIAAAGAGRGAAAGAALALLAAVVRRRRRRRGTARAPLGAVAALAILTTLGALGASARPARADGRVAITTFDPAPATRSAGFQLQVPDVGERGSWAMAAVISHATDPLTVRSGAAAPALSYATISRSTLVSVGVAVALLGRLELGARMPYLAQAGEGNRDPLRDVTVSPAGSARGDATLHAKLRLGRARLAGAGAASAGALVQVALPTSAPSALTGTGEAAARVLLLGALTPGALQRRVTLTLNAGAIVRPESRYENVVQRSGGAWGLGLEVRARAPLALAAEAYGELVPGGRRDAMDRTTALSPIEWLAGLRWRAAPGVALGLAVGRGLTSAIGTPALRGVAMLTVAPGAPGAPGAPEPRRPPSVREVGTDGDGDGVPDRDDRCPVAAEDRDLFDDSDGCPDPDNDGDRVADADDRCPISPEDADGFQDRDGCPDRDDDDDGIPDAIDRCPREREDADGFEDTDGCADRDNDRDGIPDGADACVGVPETINGVDDQDGCPDRGQSTVLLSPDRLELLEGLRFGPAQQVAAASHNILGQVASVLQANAQIARLRIAVHVQASGDAGRDQALSARRAEALRDWLIRRGVAASRLDARGYGSSRPLVDPRSKSAAAVNTRVELIILERR